MSRTTLAIDDEMTRKEKQVIRNIQVMFKVHHSLRGCVTNVQVCVQDNVVVLRGTVDSASIKNQIVPAIRQAGVLWSVSNRVEVV